MNLSDEHRLYAIFFVGWVGADWMAQVASDDGGKSFFVLHRLRIHDEVDPDNVWDGFDRKFWYRSKHPLTLDQSLYVARQLQDRMVKTMPLPIVGSDDVVDVDGDQKRLMGNLKDKPWVHMKEFDSKEAAEKFIAGRKPS